jgi:tetratricopeptide (TPR) repeat protein
VLIQSRRYPEAIDELHRMRDLGAPPFFWGYLGNAYAASGDRDKALAILAELQDASTKRYVSPICQAFIYAGLGDKPRTLEWLERSYQARSGQLLWIKQDRMFEGLRSEPRFKELLRKIHLDQ